MNDQDRISPDNINAMQTSDENKEKYQLGDYTKFSKLISQELYGRQ